MDKVKAAIRLSHQPYNRTISITTDILESRVNIEPTTVSYEYYSYYYGEKELESLVRVLWDNPSLPGKIDVDEYKDFTSKYKLWLLSK